MPNAIDTLQLNASGVKRKPESEDEDDDGVSCPICLDVWTNSGAHRLSSLRCGHLFGNSCIKRWLETGCERGNRRCPQCNKKAKLRDVRVLYATKVQAVDRTECDALRKELDETLRDKAKIELELARATLSNQLSQKVIKNQKECIAELMDTGNQALAAPVQPLRQGPARFTVAQRIEICKDGGCRVLSYCNLLSLLVVSQRSTNNLFSGYGIKKIDAIEFRPTQFVFLHPKPIRDMAFHPTSNDMLLSVSLDRCAKLLNVSSNCVVQTCNTDTPLWSCCWDKMNPNIFYVGSQNSNVLQYDIRMCSTPVSRLVMPLDMSPVTSLASVTPNPDRAMPRGGFLACTLNSCFTYEVCNEGFVPTRIPFDGPFISMCYDADTEHVLLSSRPNANNAHARHILCQLHQTRFNPDPSVTCLPIHTYISGTSQKLLSRPCVFPIREDVLVAAHHETSKAIAVWSASSGEQVHSLPTSDALIDFKPMRVNNSQYLATLSEKVLRIYNVT